MMHGLRWRRRAWLVSLLWVIGHVAYLNAQVPSGALRLDGRRLPLQTDTFTIYLIRASDTIQSGTVVDRLSSDGKLITRVYQSVDRALGNQLDTIVSRLDDLRPISYHSRSPRLIAQLTFEAAAVRGWVRLANGDSIALDVPYTGPLYDGASFDLVARSGDLREGAAFSVPTFLVGSNTITTLRGRIDGSSEVDGHACWVFVGNFAGMPVTFWIDKQNRALRRQLMQIQVDFGIMLAKPRPAPIRKRAT